jgi:hypothetical protein
MFYSTLWAYRTSVKTATGFSPFQLIYRLEAVLPIECQISSLKLAVQIFPDTSPLEERLLYIDYLDEQCQDAALANEAHKQKVKCHYDHSIHPRIFSKGNLVMVYDQDKDPLGAGKFKPMWFIPFIMKEVLKKGAYHLVDSEGNSLAESKLGSTSRSITRRWVSLGDNLYICIVLIHFIFSFCGCVIFYVIFFTVAYVK